MLSKSIKKCLKNYFKISGYLNVEEYWLFVLFIGIWVLAALLFYIDFIMYAASVSIFLFWIFALIVMFLFIPFITATCRRLHDTNRSAAFIFFNFIPVVGQIILIIFLSQATVADSRFK